MTPSPYINQYMFATEFESLAFVGVAGELKFSVKRGGKTLVDCAYWPDSDGRVDVYDLDILFNGELAATGSIADDFVIEAGGKTWKTKVFACDVSMPEPAATFLLDHFLTPCAGMRCTSIGRCEKLTAFLTEPTAVVAHCAYLNPDNCSLIEQTVDLGQATSLEPIDASPAKLQSDLGRLVSYTITCGKRKASYLVLDYEPEPDPDLIFKNCFGAWETMHLKGEKKCEPSFTRSSALVGTRTRNYKIEEIAYLRAKTGPLPEAMEPIAMDLARSPEIRLLADGAMGAEVIITDCDIKQTNDPAAMNEFEFTYRLADRLTRSLDAPRRPKVFDATFDATYG